MLRLASPTPLLALIVGACLAGTPSPALAQDPAPAPLEQPQIEAQQQPGPTTGYVELARPLIPAVVNISATRAGAPDRVPSEPEPDGDSPFEDFFRDFFGPRSQSPEGEPSERRAAGSGFIVDSDGYIVTNNHVIDGADSVTVVLHDETEHAAAVIGTDARSDLALLRIDAPDPLPTVEWGDSQSAEIGEAVLAIGNPFGLGGSVTAGIISALARDLGVGPYDEFLQTDASINRGNSGGPLFNMRGEVIGVTTAIFSPTGASIGIGFAIPSSLAQTVIGQLRETGEVQRGWIGVVVQRMDAELAQSLGLDRARGALVADVTAGAPADQAGIEIGDVILEFDGRSIDNDTRLPRVVADTEIGAAVPVTVWRDNQEQTLELAVGDMSQAPGMAQPAESDVQPEPAPEPRPELGLSLAPLTPEARQALDIDPELEGVAVSDVEPGSASAERDVQPGDVILRVGREPVSAPEDVTNAVDAAVEQGQETVLMLMRRGANNRFVALPLPRTG